MINITAPGQNDIVFYVDAQHQYQLPFFHIKLTNVFSRQSVWVNPSVIQRNRRFVKLCLTASSDPQNQNINVGLVYLFPEGSYEYELWNSPNAAPPSANSVLVETGLAEVIITEKEVELLEYISTNEDLEAVVYVGISDICPDGNCPDLVCGEAPQIGQIVGGGIVYKVNTTNRIFYVAGLNDLDGSYEWGGFGKQIVGDDGLSGKIDTELNQQQIGQKGQAADILKNKIINGYNDWYIPSYQEWQDAISAVGTQSINVDDRLYWTSTQTLSLNQPITNDILYSNLFLKDNVYWSDVDRDRTLIPNIFIFGGDFDAQEYGDYPAEISDVEIGSSALYYQQTGERITQEVAPTASVLEPRTYYTYRVYLKPLSNTFAEGQIYFSSTHTGNSANSSIFLKWGNNIILDQIGSFVEAKLTPLDDNWYRLEITFPTFSPVATGVIVDWLFDIQTITADFSFIYSSPTFRKGRYNRHGAFVAPQARVPRVRREYLTGLLNPEEGTYSIGIGGFDGAPDNTLQDINGAFFHVGTHSQNTIIHARNNGYRYLKLSTGADTYDRQEPFSVWDLDSGSINRFTAETMNYIYNNSNPNDGRWGKARILWEKEYKKDIWGEYTSWRIGATLSNNLSPRFYWDLINRTAGETFSLTTYVRSEDNQQVEFLIMNTAESVPNISRWNPNTKTFTLTQTTNYIVSATATPNAIGDWDRVNLTLRIPSGQTTLRANISPYPGGSTNQIPNNSFVGGVVGTPGTTPWQIEQRNLTRTIVAIGTETADDGTIVDYVDVRFTGTPSNTTDVFLLPASTTAVGATTSQRWDASVYVKKIADPNPPSNGYVACEERNSAGGFLVSTLQVFTPPSTLTRYSANRVLNNPLCAFVTNKIAFNIAAGVFYDFTMRIGSPQLERDTSVPTPMIKTTNGAVTRRNNIEICGVHLAPTSYQDFSGGKIESIYTTGETMFFRDDEFVKWNTPNGAPTFSIGLIPAPDGKMNTTRFNLSATYSVIETPNLVGLSNNTDFVFSCYVKTITGAVTPAFSLEIDGAPAGSSQQGSSFTWVNDGSIFRPNTTSSKGGWRSVGDGWFQVWHTLKTAPSGSVGSIQAEFRTTTAGNFYAWHPLVELGTTPSILSKVYRPPYQINENFLLSRDWNKIVSGRTNQDIYGYVNNRITFTPMKTPTGYGTASEIGTAQIYGAQAVNNFDGLASWRFIYPIETFMFKTFIPQPNTETATNGFFTSISINPQRGRYHFYRKDLYFKVRPFRQQNY